MKTLIFTIILAISLNASAMGRRHRTPTPTPKPTATVTPKPIPTVAPTPTATIAPIIKAHGIYQLDGGWTFDPANGVSCRKDLVTGANIMWKDLEPSEGTFNFSKLDAIKTKGQQSGKPVAITLTFVADPPQWEIDKVVARGGKTYQWTGGYGNKTHTILLPWDALPEILDFYKKICLYIDGNFSYMVLAGIGIFNETYMPKPSDVGLSAADMTTKMIDSDGQIFNTVGSLMHSTPWVVAYACPPVPGYGPSCDALDALLRSQAQYPTFAPANFGLNGQSNINYKPNKLISDFSATHFTLFQMVTEPLNGTFQDVLNAAITLKGHAVEVYGQYMISGNTAMLTDATNRLAP